MPRIEALLFDLDGTLCDSDPVHARAWTQVLAPLGVEMPYDRYRAEISGRLNAEIGAMLFPDRPPAEQARIADDKEALFRALAPTLRPLPGLEALLGEARGHGWDVGLVTNAPRANVEHMLAALGLAGRFDVEVLAEDVGRGKPDPLPYRVALERLRLGPEEAVVFEDSATGIRAAKAAGLKVVAVATGHGEAELLAAGADAVVADFADPRLSPLLAP